MQTVTLAGELTNRHWESNEVKVLSKIRRETVKMRLPEAPDLRFFRSDPFCFQPGKARLTNNKKISMEAMHLTRNKAAQETEGARR